MRVKDLASRLPVPSHVIKYAYLRITLTRFTTAYFIVAFIHAILLAGFQLGSHSSNRTADAILSRLMKAAEVRSDLIPVISNDGGRDVLRLCDGIPSSSNDDRCETIFVPTPAEGPSRTTINDVTSGFTTIPLSRFNAVASPTLQEAQQQTDLVTDSLDITTSSTIFVSTSTFPTAESTSVAEFVVAEVSIATTTSTSTVSRVETTTSADALVPISTTDVSSSIIETPTSVGIVLPLTPITIGISETSTRNQEPATTRPPSDIIEEVTRLTNIIATRTLVVTIAPTPSQTSVPTLIGDPGTVGTDTPTGGDAITSSMTRQESPSVVVADFSSGIQSVSLESPEPKPQRPTAIRPIPILGTSAFATLTTEERPIFNVSRPTQAEGAPGEDEQIVFRRTVNVVPVVNSTTGAIAGLNVTDLSLDGTSALSFVELRCAQALSIAQEQLHQQRAEDLVMIGYYLWLFGLETVAVLNESIPHLSAAFVSLLLALVWSGSQFARTRAFRKEFDAFITIGACNGLNILPNYWPQRSRTEIPSFALNAVGIVLLGGMGFKLLSVYKRQTTKLVGESKLIKHLYRTSLIFSIIVQIGSFLLLASVALWVQQLFESPIASFSATTPVFKGLGLLSVLVSVPWFLIGWVAIRREHKILMVVFLLMNAFFLGSWTAVFSSDIYRIVFTKWTFFSALTVATFFLLVGSLITGILCRIHFGEGLAVQLAEHTQDEVDTTSWDFSSGAEKAWEPFEQISIRQSQFTASDRQSSAFSYGLRSPAPPMPTATPRMFGSIGLM